MNQSKFIEIHGSVTAPCLPATKEGAPRLLVLAKAGERLLGYCSAQLGGSPMPFSLCLQREALLGAPELTLHASCGAAPGQAAATSQVTLGVTVPDHSRVGPLALTLSEIPQAAQAHATRPQVPPVVQALEVRVVIPEPLQQADAFLDVTLLRLQEDGYVNRAASNICDASQRHAGDGSAFTLQVDANVLASGDRLKLNVGLYNLARDKVLAGATLRDLTPATLGQLGTVTLRAPQR